ncbi:ABC transporter ATP-binding protein [Amaricoccus sp.]|uniref:ABC transporter ATP-binding protein n=1 Tax=Amaricoccus sp. TaxID=1872485 RepID=UPI001B767EB7|nr:ABC transporter ATP-binding protein [Amaricoccus sp.]MBP7242110.1 ABC transporter ATP-binding protein [Amaricoccus sp.]
MLDGPAPVLEVSDLQTVFQMRDGAVHAVNGVSFAIAPGELLGVVGESGSGKSVTMMSLMRLLPSPPARIVGGEIRYQGRDVRRMSDAQMRELRGGEIGFVFQDPMTSLNPVFTVGYQLVEPLRVHLGLSKSAARARAAELLKLVGIPDAARRLDDYPHQFSGGMRQRVMIAMALSCDPKVLIADEPTTALDVTIQAQILEIVRDLRQKLGMGIIWITHDLGLVAGIADRVMVMYAGQVVEHGPVKAIFSDPQHPYTRALLATVPSVTGPRATRLRTIEGQPPILLQYPRACPFAPRCRHAFNRCRVENPTRIPVGEGHDVACWWDPATDEPRHV